MKNIKKLLLALLCINNIIQASLNVEKTNHIFRAIKHDAFIEEVKLVCTEAPFKAYMLIIDGEPLTTGRFIDKLTDPNFHKLMMVLIAPSKLPVVFDSCELDFDHPEEIFYFIIREKDDPRLKLPKADFSKFMRGPTKALLKKDIAQGKLASTFPTLEGTFPVRDIIIPTPIKKHTKGNNCLSLWQFIHTADMESMSALWNLCAQKIKDRKAQGKKTWLSFHGMEVPWLHARLTDTTDWYSKFQSKPQLMASL